MDEGLAVAVLETMSEAADVVVAAPETISEAAQEVALPKVVLKGRAQQPEPEGRVWPANQLHQPQGRTRWVERSVLIAAPNRYRASVADHRHSMAA